MRDPQPDQVRDLRGMFAQVAAECEHRLGGADRVVESTPGHLGTEPYLERACQDLERPQLGREHIDSPVLDLREGLPVESVQPGRPVRLPKRRPTVLPQRLGRQFGKRHGQVAGTIGNGLFRIKKVPLDHEALEVTMGGVAGVQLPQFRQELILQHGLWRRHRTDGEMDRRLLGTRIQRERSQQGGGQDGASHRGILLA